ncbi:MAG: hypothetical protein CMJ76_09565 [Planctomycetaceae bacterium]|nr:hypothetical protein [Planctomycetaceae bacterium]|tara:strand:- start:2495 stop:3583 length:1089 start_codon:yes stop_codon:yes gene_type:complete
MGWHEVLGHGAQIDRFRRNLKSGRLASAFLFIGPEGIGKQFFARKLTQALFCEEHSEYECEPCSHCPSCQQVMTGTHPDLHFVELLAGTAEIRTAQIVGGAVKINDKEENFPGVCYEVNLKPISAKRKVVIINDADSLNDTSTANLLKTLEEPPPGAVIILLGTSLSQQLDTIISRCQVISFNSLLPEHVQQILLQQRVVNDSNQALELAMISNGSVELARRYLDSELLETRSELLNLLATLPQHPEKLSAMILKLVDVKSLSRPEKMEQLEFLTSIVVSCLHQVLLQLSGQSPTGDPLLQEIGRRIVDDWSGDVETCLACIDRTLETSFHARANANVKTLIDAWVDDLSQIWIHGGFKLPT